MPRLRQIRRRYGGKQQAEPEYDESDSEGARTGGAPGSDETQVVPGQNRRDPRYGKGNCL